MRYQPRGIDVKNMIKEKFSFILCTTFTMTNLISFVSLGGLPFSTYAPKGGGGGGVQDSYTFPLRITCKKGGRGSR